MHYRTLGLAAALAAASCGSPWMGRETFRDLPTADRLEVYNYAANGAFLSRLDMKPDFVAGPKSRILPAAVTMMIEGRGCPTTSAGVKPTEFAVAFYKGDRLVASFILDKTDGYCRHPSEDAYTGKVWDQDLMRFRQAVEEETRWR